MEAQIPMRGSFKCTLKTEDGPCSWNGEWAIRLMTYRFVELEVYDSYTYFVIIGKYVNGNFVCIPNWDVGCPLSFELTDKFWNFERLCKSMEPRNAKTLTMAIDDFSKKTHWGEGNLY